MAKVNSAVLRVNQKPAVGRPVRRLRDGRSVIEVRNELIDKHKRLVRASRILKQVHVMAERQAQMLTKQRDKLKVKYDAAVAKHGKRLEARDLWTSLKELNNDVKVAARNAQTAAKTYKQGCANVEKAAKALAAFKEKTKQA